MEYTSFQVYVVSSTTVVARERWQQFAVATDWTGGICKAEVVFHTAVMMWLFLVQDSSAANLVEKIMMKSSQQRCSLITKEGDDNADVRI